MKKYLPILVAFLVTMPVLLGACCAQKRPMHYHASPIARLRLHGDVAFSPLERGLVEAACRDLLLQDDLRKAFAGQGRGQVTGAETRPVVGSE